MNKRRLLTVGAGIFIAVAGLGFISTSKSEVKEYKTKRKHNDISTFIETEGKIRDLERKLETKPRLRDLYDTKRIEEIKGWLDEYAMMQISQAKMLEDEEFKSKWNRFNTELMPNYYIKKSLSFLCGTFGCSRSDHTMNGVVFVKLLDIRTYSALALCASGLLAFGALASKKSQV